jgi:hypothetical protein
VHGWGEEVEDQGELGVSKNNKREKRNKETHNKMAKWMEKVGGALCWEKINVRRRSALVMMTMMRGLSLLMSYMCLASLISTYLP